MNWVACLLSHESQSSVGYYTVIASSSAHEAQPLTLSHVVGSH